MEQRICVSDMAPGRVLRLEIQGYYDNGNPVGYSDPSLVAASVRWSEFSRRLSLAPRQPLSPHHPFLLRHSPFRKAHQEHESIRFSAGGGQRFHLFF